MVLTLFSCEQQLQKKDNTAEKGLEKEISSQRLIQDTDTSYSAKLARIGEILVNNPVGVTHAHDMFNQALKLDPQNNKALFYSAFTEILMTMKGSINRTKSMHDEEETYAKVLKYLTNDMKYPEFIDFLAGDKNQTKLENYQEIKRFFQTEVLSAFESAKNKIDRINSPIEIILTQLKTENKEVKYDCNDINLEDETYTSCSIKEDMSQMNVLPAKIVNVDTDDLKILSGGLEGYATVLKFYTSYKVTGQKNLTNEVKVKEIELGRALTEKELHRIVKRYNNYLVLEDDNRMSEIINNLENVVSIGMDFESLNNQFCDNDLRANNLIKSICFPETARKDMQKTLDYLSGPQEYLMGYTKTGDEVNILVDVPAILNNPIKDLKTLMPNDYNDEGESNHTVEPNTNGLFPNGDLLEKSKLLD